MKRFLQMSCGAGMSLGGAIGLWLATPLPLATDPIMLPPLATRSPTARSPAARRPLPVNRSQPQVKRPTHKAPQQPTISSPVAAAPKAVIGDRVARPRLTPVVAVESGSRLVIDLSRRQVSLYQAGSRKTYPIAVGRAGWETPTGRFRVMDMRQDPTWINPFTGQAIAPYDPQNPLGGYWIGFWTDGKNWIGFHGTPNVASVGSAASHGCVRMYRQDIAELFAQVTPGMPVVVQP